MKAIKVLSLAALAALTAMAFVGASSAMAESTALCDVDPGTGSSETCPSGHLISHVHEVTLEGKPATLLTVVEVKCTALFLGDVKSANNLGEPLEISGNLTYSGCVRENGKTCEVKEESASSTVKVLKSGHELAFVTGEGEVHVKCGILIDCTYNGVDLEAHYLGPLLSEAANGEARLEEQTTNKTKGAFCPGTAKLDILTTPLEIEHKDECGVITKLKTYITK